MINEIPKSTETEKENLSMRERQGMVKNRIDSNGNPLMPRLAGQKRVQPNQKKPKPKTSMLKKATGKWAIAAIGGSIGTGGIITYLLT